MNTVTVGLSKYLAACSIIVTELLDIETDTYATIHRK
jgi:hypothetical protein